MPAQMNVRLGANAMVAAETTPSAPPKISVRRRPSKIGGHAAGDLTQQADAVENALGQADLRQRKAAGRQQRDPDGSR